MCGNSTSIQQIVVTADRTAPEFTAPGDLTLECSDAALTGEVGGYAVPEYTPGDGLHAEAMDNCDPEITVTYEDGPDDGLSDGVHYPPYLQRLRLRREPRRTSRTSPSTTAPLRSSPPSRRT